MNKQNLIALLLLVVLLFLPVISVQAVPPLPTTVYGKAQASGSDLPDGTQVSAWMGSTEPVVTGTPLSFAGTGVSLTFSQGCSGEATALHQSGATQVISQGSYTSVYALDVLGPPDWVPPDDPATEGQVVTLKISNTLAMTATWSIGSVLPLTLTVDSLEGDLPYTPVSVTLLGEVWDISVDCAGYTATATFTYTEGWLVGVDEADIAGMARYDAGYNRWEYVAGTVDAVANTVTVSDVTAFSLWRILASTPPLPVADLTIARSGGDAVLDWSAVTEDIKGQAISDVTYNIYRAADDPYFTPGGTPYDTTSDSTYTDVGAVGDPNTNYYYMVTAVDTVGKESAASDRVGEFDFELRRTTGTDYAWIALPLENSSLAMASHLEQHIETNCSQSASILSIARWNAPGQQLVQYTTIPIPIGDFGLQTGQAYRVESDISGADSCIWTLTGTVPRRQTVSFGLVTTTGTDYTWISLPLDQSQLAMASDLEQAIEAGSGTNVLSICRWNAVGQQFVCYTTVPIPIGNFAMEMGYPYRIEVDGMAVWP